MDREKHKTSQEDPQETYDRIRDWVEATGFGTAEYQAASDFIRLEELKELSRYQSERLLAPDDEAMRLRTQREASITDQQIALHKQHIYLSESQLPGYSKAYRQITAWFDYDLVDAVNQQAADSLPDNKTAQQAFSNSKYDAIFDDVRNAILDQRT